MTILHPARTGSAVTVWFSRGEPVGLISGGVRFRVTGEPKTADINGTRYWRVRAVGPDRRTSTIDLSETPGGWVLAGVEDDARRTGAS